MECNRGQLATPVVSIVNVAIIGTFDSDYKSSNQLF